MASVQAVCCIVNWLRIVKLSLLICKAEVNKLFDRLFKSKLEKLIQYQDLDRVPVFFQIQD